MWKRLSNLIWTSLGAGSVIAQVTIQSATIEPTLISPQTFFQVALHNMGPAVVASLEGELQTRSGEAVLSFRSEPFRLAGGGGIFSASEFRMQQFSYGPGEAGRAAQRFQRLADGEYRYCIRLHAPQSEGGDAYCDMLSVETFLHLGLVNPWDGDTLEQTRPALTWMMAGPGPTLATADIRIVLVPQRAGQSAAQALSAERPVFMVPHVKERTLPYPFGVAGLEPGQCYAWQAERVVGSRVTDRSEPWGFCVRKHVEPLPNKYVRLDRVEPGAVYEAADRRIYFRYDEPYASAQVDCSILDERGGHVRPQLQDDAGAAAEMGVRSVGVNLYELDLQPYGLKPGYYDLVVRNEKGRARTMKFHVPR